ncbi:MAG TPA: hypothetical protein VFK16_04145 [Gemmatimonadaceae bacterium]|nr:hypothetical protein [Gemmatimonadaceae bacterium]
MKNYLAGTPCVSLPPLGAARSLASDGGKQMIAADEASSGDEYVAANYHHDLVTSAIEEYSGDLSMGGGFAYEAYEGGLSAFDAQVFEAAAAQQYSNLSTYNDLEEENYGDGMRDLPEPYTVFRWPGWAKAMLAGCTGNVVANGGTVIARGVEGFAAGGPAGAVGGAAGSVVYYCGWGALAGWVAYHTV